MQTVSINAASNCMAASRGCNPTLGGIAVPFSVFLRHQLQLKMPSRLLPHSAWLSSAFCCNVSQLPHDSCTRRGKPCLRTSFPESGYHRVDEVLVARKPVVWGVVLGIISVSDER